MITATLPSGAEILPLPEGPFDVIVADPPWKFQTHSDKGQDRAADNHYACMSLEDILALPVREIAAKDCVLYLWGTTPLLPESLRVANEWGFKYVSKMTWDKGVAGTGYWTRNQDEHVLICKRGSHRAPEPKFRAPSVISARRMKHSQKPDDIHMLADLAWPSDRKIELFARRPYPGWTVWGSEVKVGYCEKGGVA